MSRFRFSHVGVGIVAAIGMAAVTVIGGVVAAPSPPPSVFVPITPCRLVDTRATETVGTRAAPIGPGEIATFAVWGTNGNCTIPNTAVGLATNTTAVNPTSDSYLTLWPADADKPLASNLNWLRTSPPTPNQVTVGLSASGAIKVFNLGGTIDVIVDIMGYYVAPSAQVPPTVYVTTRQSAVPLLASAGVNGAVTVNSMFLPAGSYLVTFTATLVNFSATGDYFRCAIFMSGAPIAVNTVFLGPDVSPVVPITVQTVLTPTFGGTTAVGSYCQHDSALPATNNYYVDPGATFSAVPITVAGSGSP